MKASAKKRRVRCIRCKELFKRNDPKISFAPDPYNEDVRNDSTKVWQCKWCANESAADI